MNVLLLIIATPSNKKPNYTFCDFDDVTPAARLSFYMKMCRTIRFNWNDSDPWLSALISRWVRLCSESPHASRQICNQPIGGKNDIF